MPTATLTRIRPNPRSHIARRALHDYPHLHQTLMRLVPDNLGPHPRRAAGLLFRIEGDRRQPVLLVQTAAPPTPERLPEGFGTTESLDLSPMFNNLTPGRRVLYRITANPSKRTYPPGATSRHGVVRPLNGDDILAWWQRRAHAAGLAPESATWEIRPFRRGPQRHGPCHRLVQFDGTATITDPDALTDALCAGIGKAKSYGGGLLSLAPTG